LCFEDRVAVINVSFFRTEGVRWPPRVGRRPSGITGSLHVQPINLNFLRMQLLPRIQRCGTNLIPAVHSSGTNLEAGFPNTHTTQFQAGFPNTHRVSHLQSSRECAPSRATRSHLLLQVLPHA
jgi:hypothetical protein